MTRNDKITLVCKTQAGSVVTEHASDVFCAKKSVTRSEFYAAYEVGLRLKAVFEIALDDWKYACYSDSITGKVSEPIEATFNSQRYNIVRSYEHDDIVEVMCG